MVGKRRKSKNETPEGQGLSSHSVVDRWTPEQIKGAGEKRVSEDDESGKNGSHLNERPPDKPYLHVSCMHL